MADRYKDRLKILEDQEIEELYGRPQFNHDERVHFFGLTPEERAVADGHYNLASRVLFILQVGYFKAKTLFFAFELDDVQEDVRYILQQHYPGFHDAELTVPSLKQTRHTQQRKILDLYGYRACNADARAALMEKAGQLVRISAKPIFLFRNLLQYLESRRIVVPGYSFLQDAVSQALADERARLTAILEERLDHATLEALDALYLVRDGMYAVTPLKRDPKDFSLREMKSRNCAEPVPGNLVPDGESAVAAVGYLQRQRRLLCRARRLLYGAKAATTSRRHGAPLSLVFPRAALPENQR